MDLLSPVEKSEQHEPKMQLSAWSTSSEPSLGRFELHTGDIEDNSQDKKETLAAKITKTEMEN